MTNTTHLQPDDAHPADDPTGATAAHPHAGPNPTHIVTLDQEDKDLVIVIDGAPTTYFDPANDLRLLPAGGGLVIADGNVWAVRNPLSQSQYCWSSTTDRDLFLTELERRGYRAISVSNKLAESLYRRTGEAKADAVRALYSYAHTQVSTPKGAHQQQHHDHLNAAAGQTGTALPCGCQRHYGFDSGRPVGTDRDGRGDRSRGQRARVVRDFLRLQNDDGYDSDFTADVIAVAWEALDRQGRELFNLAKTRPQLGANKSPNRLLAVAVCTHDPYTGALRTHEGRPWGRSFIVRSILGLNGLMRGTGPAAPGNPMRAVLRVLGRRTKDNVNRDERAAMDRSVNQIIRALQTAGPLRPVAPADEDARALPLPLPAPAGTPEAASPTADTGLAA